MQTAFPLNIFFDNFKKKIYLREYINNEVVFDKYDYDPTYYLDSDEDTGWHDIFGNNVKAIKGVDRDAIKRYKQSDRETFEMDVRPEIKFLHDRYRDMELNGDFDKVNIGYIDIETDVYETDVTIPDTKLTPRGINLITVKSSLTGEMVTFGTEEYYESNNYEGTDISGTYYAFPRERNPEGILLQNEYNLDQERKMLSAFTRWFRKQRFDLITGWNSSRFDMPYIFNRIVNLIGEDELKKLSPYNLVRQDYQENYYIPGVYHLDMMEIYKNFTFGEKASYSLDNIAQAELGAGKLDFGMKMWEIQVKDFDMFTDYNKIDVLRLEELESELKYLKLAYLIGLQTKIPMDKVESLMQIINGYLLGFLHKENKVLPDKKNLKDFKDWWVEGEHFKVGTYLQNTLWEDGETRPEEFFTKGGHVGAKRGFHQYVMSYDFTSLYPSAIMHYNISPETKVICPTEEEIKSRGLIKSEINDIWFSPEEGILPSMMRTLFAERIQQKRLSEDFYEKGDSAQAAYWDGRQMITKLILNSTYGVLINKHFAFWDPDLSRCITRGGRVAIRFSEKAINKHITQDSFKNKFIAIAKKHNIYKDQE